MCQEDVVLVQERACGAASSPEPVHRLLSGMLLSGMLHSEQLSREIFTVVEEAFVG